MTNLRTGFRIDLLYPDEYKDFIAEIYYDDKFLCLISQENGVENREMEFDSDMGQIKVKFALSDFQDAIKYAIRRLNDLRKT